MDGGHFFGVKNMKVLVAKLVSNKEITSIGRDIDSIITDMQDHGGELSAQGYYQLKDGSFNIYDTYDDIVAYTEQWTVAS